jgi:hypothetical protein
MAVGWESSAFGTDVAFWHRAHHQAMPLSGDACIRRCLYQAMPVSGDACGASHPAAEHDER